MKRYENHPGKNQPRKKVAPRQKTHYLPTLCKNIIIYKLTGTSLKYLFGL